MSWLGDYSDGTGSARLEPKESPPVFCLCGRNNAQVDGEMDHLGSFTCDRCLSQQWEEQVIGRITLILQRHYKVVIYEALEELAAVVTDHA
jgi:hypothetical protein